MGVPRLFKWVSEHYPNAIEHFIADGGASHIENPCKKFKVNHLYLDANGILHGCAQLIFNYGQGKRLIEFSPNTSFEDKINQVYINFFNQIRTIVEIVCPTKTLYIAIDGTAPLAKQAQQRQRRFVSAKESKNNDFDSNCMTPGTEFMHNLNKYIKRTIEYEIKHNVSWQKFKVIFSPSNAYGEGEHKIMEYIRSLPIQCRMKDSHCMYGPDGDLLMLTLATHCPNIFLFREDQYNRGMYYYIDMMKIRKGLIEEMVPPRDEVPAKKELNNDEPGTSSRGASHKELSEECKIDIINDFILLGFFVGNDFLPKIEMVVLLEEGLDMMLNLYREKNYSFTKNGEIIIKEFYKFIKDISELEAKYLCMRSARPALLEKFENVTLKECITLSIAPGESDRVNLQNSSIGRIIDFNKYKLSYYSKKLKFSSRTELITMCNEYMKGICWVFYYYTKKCPSYKWFYPYHYPPFMVDLVRYQGKHENEFFTKDNSLNNIPSEPFLQLLCVLPPQSYKLLPKQYWDLMISPKSPLHQFYPLSFEIDYEGKQKEYQGVSILPFIDLNLVKSVYLPLSTAKGGATHIASKEALLESNVDERNVLLESGSVFTF